VRQLAIAIAKLWAPTVTPAEAAHGS